MGTLGQKGDTGMDGDKGINVNIASHIITHTVVASFPGFSRPCTIGLGTRLMLHVFYNCMHTITVHSLGLLHIHCSSECCSRTHNMMMFLLSRERWGLMECRVTKETRAQRELTE